MARQIVAIDARKAAGPRTGIGRYVFEVARRLPAMAPELEFQLLSDRPVPDRDAVPGCRHVVLGRRPVRWGRFEKAYAPWWVNVAARRHLDSAGVALFHGANFVVPRAGVCPSISTIHDLAFLCVPQAYSPVYRYYIGAQVRRAVRDARAIVAVSQATKDDIVKMLGVNDSRIAVIRHGVGSEFRVIADRARLERIRQRYGLRENYVMHVGVVQRRKNLVVLIDAAARLIREGILGQLALVGDDGYGSADVRRRISFYRMPGRLVLLGRVPQEDIPALYNSASIAVMPSLYEGFGMPLLEAMACGCPVIASATSSHPEVAGGAALLVSPGDVGELAGAMRTLLADDDHRRAMCQAGLARARQFSWDASAAAHLALYREVLSAVV